MQHLRCGHALIFNRREAARENRFANQRDGHAQIERADAGPLAGAFLSGGIENLVHHRLAVFIFLGEDFGGNFDEEAVEFTLIPIGENRG